MDVNNVLNNLKDDGVFIIENFIDTSNLELLNKEFYFILKKDIIGINPIDYSLGQAKVIHKLDCDFTNLPKTKEVFFNDTFKSIADTYLKVDNELNKEIFVVKDVVGSEHHANDLHFDVVNTFKFFIYLTDTNEENGAFCCVPGSHKRTAEIRKDLGQEISYENRHLTRELPYEESEVISVNGKAGTLIIFDTDVFHKAGHVSIGERKVMRGHTRPIQKAAVEKNKKSISLFKKIVNKLKK